MDGYLEVIISCHYHHPIHERPSRLKSAYMYIGHFIRIRYTFTVRFLYLFALLLCWICGVRLPAGKDVTLYDTTHTCRISCYNTSMVTRYMYCDIWASSWEVVEC